MIKSVSKVVMFWEVAMSEQCLKMSENVEYMEINKTLDSGGMKIFTTFYIIPIICIIFYNTIVYSIYTSLKN